MIKINNVNKYYFKGESRELHVVNNVSVELPSSGLVTILGASGSGKTTLLNIIGGLDCFDSGSIDYYGNLFTKYKAKSIDLYRSKHIGYIFQNYLLLEDLSVYNNLKEALEIIGVFDRSEQRKRIEYALRKVGLYKYRKKKVKFLSGGQMQRVSIARALIKNAEIIIADEPTGNIDSENTIEIMNILKKISKKTLVLLITHELEIARFYSDRIIQIKDGTIISDGNIIDKGKLSQQTDRKIYLGDYEKHNISHEAIDLNLYYDQTLGQTSLQIIIKNDTIYISSNNRIVNVDETSLEIINDKYEHVEKPEVESFDYDTSWYTESEPISKWKLFFKGIKNGFIDFFTTKRGKIPFMIIFMILGSIIGIAAINLTKYSYPDLSAVYGDPNVYVTMEEDDYERYICPEQNTTVLTSGYEAGYIKEIIPIQLFSGQLTIKTNYIQSIRCDISAFIAAYHNDLELIMGSKPNNAEVVISKKLADEVVTEFNVDYDNLLNRTIYDYYNEYKIVGIADSDEYFIYANPINLYNINSRFERIDSLAIGYRDAYNNCFEIVEGRDIENQSEIIVSQSFKGEFNLNLGDEYEINNQSLKIVGFFNDNNIVDCNNVLTSNLNVVGFRFNPISMSNQTASHNYTIGYLPNQYYTIVSGKLPTNNHEVLVNINSGLVIGDTVQGQTVVGCYQINYQEQQYGSTTSFDDFIIMSTIAYINTLNSYSIDGYLGFIPNEGASEFFNDENYQMLSIKDYQSDYLIKENKSQQSFVPIFIGFLLLFVIFYTYFSNRSKMINEIYKIGVYRSLGASKKSIISKYLAFNFAQTTMSSIIGYILTFIIYISFNLYIGNLFGGKFIAQPLIMIAGVIVIYLINLLVGILPISLLLRKTPAEINSKYDI